MQLAGNNTVGWFIRGKQSANVTLSGVTWDRLVTNSGTWNISISGNAATSTKATQDKNGLQIDTGYLKLTGGTMTGNITMRTNTSMSTGIAPSANTNFNRIQWEDKDGYSTGGLGNRWYTDGVEAMEIYEAKRKTDGTYIYNQMALGFKSDDTPYVWLGQPATWRSALGLGARATDNMTYFPYHEVTSLDANSAISGIYSCKASVTNAPVTNHGVLIDFHFVGTPFQIFMPDNINYMYKRWYTSGAWTAWHIMNAAWA